MERIRQKIGRINQHLAIIRSIKDDYRVKFSIDPVYRGALLHYLYLLSDGCIVLAELIIKQKGLRIPQSYAESFDILGDSKILNADFAYRFASIAGFRNFLAHDYEKIDQGVICGQIVDSLDDVDNYLQQISVSLGLDMVHTNFLSGQSTTETSSAIFIARKWQKRSGSACPNTLGFLSRLSK